MRFGTDGVRGAANTELTAEFALRLGRAAARVLGGGSENRLAVIGGDTRESTPMFDAALSAGLASEGLHVTRLGVVPTPLVAFEAQRQGAIGAVVSASHNGFGDNGIKIFAAGGLKLSDELERRIEAELELLTDPLGDPGTITTALDPTPYIDHVLGMLEGRRLDGLRVVIDAANGAAHVVAPDVLRAAGADVIVVADTPDGRNINDGCGATVPSFVADAVVASGADVGVALDGDADRLIAVDHRGDVVDGDHILAITATDLRDRRVLRDDTVVVTVMTNLGFHLAMRQSGIRVVQTAVGDRYVLEALNEGGYSLGGEQSGHVIFADHATTGDGLLTAVALLDTVKRSGRSLESLAASAMTSLPQVLVNIRVTDRVPDAADRLADEIAAAERRLGSTGRVLVRASGTEPLVRVMVEAATSDEAGAVADALAAAAIRHFGSSAPSGERPVGSL
jgi:phosphoglucosamine mutase